MPADKSKGKASDGGGALISSVMAHLKDQEQHMAKKRARDRAKQRAEEAARQANVYTSVEFVRTEKRKAGRFFIRESVAFSIFLCMFTVLTVNQRPNYAFESAELIRQRLVGYSPTGVPLIDERRGFGDNFRDMRSVSHFWSYLEERLLPELFSATSYTRVATPYDQTLAWNNNRLLGPLRLRQVRIQGGVGHCESGATNEIDLCQATCQPDDFAVLYEAKDPYGAPTIDDAAACAENCLPSVYGGRTLCPNRKLRPNARYYRFTPLVDSSLVLNGQLRLAAAALYINKTITVEGEYAGGSLAEPKAVIRLWSEAGVNDFRQDACDETAFVVDAGTPIQLATIRWKWEWIGLGKSRTETPEPTPTPSETATPSGTPTMTGTATGTPTPIPTDRFPPVQIIPVNDGNSTPPLAPGAPVTGGGRVPVEQVYFPPYEGERGTLDEGGFLRMGDLFVGNDGVVDEDGNVVPQRGWVGEGRYGGGAAGDGTGNVGQVIQFLIESSNSRQGPWTPILQSGTHAPLQGESVVPGLYWEYRGKDELCFEAPQASVTRGFCDNQALSYTGASMPNGGFVVDLPRQGCSGKIVTQSVADALSKSEVCTRGPNGGFESPSTIKSEDDSHTLTTTPTFVTTTPRTVTRSRSADTAAAPSAPLVPLAVPSPPVRTAPTETLTPGAPVPAAPPPPEAVVVRILYPLWHPEPGAPLTPAQNATLSAWTTAYKTGEFTPEDWLLGDAAWYGRLGWSFRNGGVLPAFWFATSNQILRRFRMISLPRLKLLHKTPERYTLSQCPSNESESESGSGSGSGSRRRGALRSGVGKAVSDSDSDAPPPSIPTRLEMALMQLAELRERKWVDRQTRFVIAEFSLFNANVQLLTSTRLTFEFTPTGQILSYDSIKPVSTYTLDQPHDFLLLLLEVLVFVWIIWYAVREIYEVYKYLRVPRRECFQCQLSERGSGATLGVQCVVCRKVFDAFEMKQCPQCTMRVPDSHTCRIGYFEDIWNYLDLVLLPMMVIVFIYTFRLRLLMSEAKFFGDDVFTSYYPLAWQTSFISYINTINLLLVYLKSLKYLDKIHVLTVLTSTLRGLVWPVGSFLVLFFIMFFGSAGMHVLIFGTEFEELSTFVATCESLAINLLLNFDQSFPDIRAILEPTAGPLLFIFHNMMFGLLLVTIFVSLVDQAYIEANQEAQSGLRDFFASAVAMFVRDATTFIYNILGATCFSRSARKHFRSVAQREASVLILEKMLHTTPDAALVTQVRLFMTDLEEYHDPALGLEILKVFLVRDLAAHVPAPMYDGATTSAALALPRHDELPQLKRNSVRSGSRSAHAHSRAPHPLAGPLAEAIAARRVSTKEAAPLPEDPKRNSDGSRGDAEASNEGDDGDDNDDKGKAAVVAGPPKKPTKEVNVPAELDVMSPEGRPHSRASHGTVETAGSSVFGDDLPTSEDEYLVRLAHAIVRAARDVTGDDGAYNPDAAAELHKRLIQFISGTDTPEAHYFPRPTDALLLRTVVVAYHRAKAVINQLQAGSGFGWSLVGDGDVSHTPDIPIAVAEAAALRRGHSGELHSRAGMGTRGSDAVFGAPPPSGIPRVSTARRNPPPFVQSRQQSGEFASPSFSTGAAPLLGGGTELLGANLQQPRAVSRARSRSLFAGAIAAPLKLISRSRSPSFLVGGSGSPTTGSARAQSRGGASATSRAPSARSTSQARKGLTSAEGARPTSALVLTVSVRKRSRPSSTAVGAGAAGGRVGTARESTLGDKSPFGPVRSVSMPLSAWNGTAADAAAETYSIDLSEINLIHAAVSSSVRRFLEKPLTPFDHAVLQLLDRVAGTSISAPRRGRELKGIGGRTGPSRKRTPPGLRRVPQQTLDEVRDLQSSVQCMEDDLDALLDSFEALRAHMQKRREEVAAAAAAAAAAAEEQAAAAAAAAAAEEAARRKRRQEEQEELNAMFVPQIPPSGTDPEAVREGVEGSQEPLNAFRFGRGPSQPRGGPEELLNDGVRSESHSAVSPHSSAAAGGGSGAGAQTAADSVDWRNPDPAPLNAPPPARLGDFLSGTGGVGGRGGGRAGSLESPANDAATTSNARSNDGLPRYTYPPDLGPARSPPAERSGGGANGGFGTGAGTGALGGSPQKGVPFNMGGAASGPTGSGWGGQLPARVRPAASSTGIGRVPLSAVQATSAQQRASPPTNASGAPVGGVMGKGGGRGGGEGSAKEGGGGGAGGASAAHGFKYSYPGDLPTERSGGSGSGDSGQGAPAGGNGKKESEKPKEKTPPKGGDGRSMRPFVTEKGPKYRYPNEV